MNMYFLNKITKETFVCLFCFLCVMSPQLCSFILPSNMNAKAKMTLASAHVWYIFETNYHILIHEIGNCVESGGN